MKKIVATNGEKYVGVKRTEDGMETILTSSVVDALNYKIVILPFVKGFILKKLKERFKCNFRLIKVQVVLEEEVNVRHK